MMTHTDATELLKRLIAIPSVSRDEKAAADFLEEQLKQQGLAPMRTTTISGVSDGRNSPTAPPCC